MTQTQRQAAESRTTARAAPPAGRLVSLVVVLAGLFGMHGLAAHGAHAAETGMGVSMVTTAAPAAEATSDLTSVVSGALSDGAMSMLCLAVLTAGALLLLRAVRRTRVALARMPAPAPPSLLAVGRDRDPPSLTALSVRRC